MIILKHDDHLLLKHKKEKVALQHKKTLERNQSIPLTHLQSKQVNSALQLSKIS